jgi:hypothetical protein
MCFVVSIKAEHPICICRADDDPDRRTLELGDLALELRDPLGQRRPDLV